MRTNILPFRRKEVPVHLYRYTCRCVVCKAEHARRLAYYRGLILSARQALKEAR